MAGLNCPSCGAAQPPGASASQCYACGSELSDDLLAPVSRSAVPELPRPTFGGPDGIDLPAPKQRGPQKAAPPLPPSIPGTPLDDLPAPVPRGKGRPVLGKPVELPAPTLPSHPKQPAAPDLPAPVAAPPPMPDLLGTTPLEDLPPSSTRPLGSELPENLPAPRGGGAPPPPPRRPDNLPAPKTTAPFGSGFPDNLPAPRTSPLDLGPPGALPDNLPAPSNNVDLPVPIDMDLLTPATGPLDMPAPKGFFDDGLAPHHEGGGDNVPAPKGFFDDGLSPQTSGGDNPPAPKGFFDEGLAPSRERGPRDNDLLAPKGFFDDLDGVDESGSQPLDLGHAPGGLPDFGSPDGLPDLEPPGGLPDLGPPGEPFDLGPPGGLPDLGPPGEPFDLGEPLDLGSAAAASKPSLDLDAIDLEPTGSGTPLDLGAPLEQRPFGLDELDLEAPSRSARDSSPFEDVSLPGADAPPPLPPTGDGVVSFSKPSDSAVAEGQRSLGRRRRSAGSNEPLELDTTQLPEEKTAQRTVAKARGPAVAAPSRKRTIAMGVALGVVVLGVGGYFGYTKLTASEQSTNKTARHLQAARVQLSKDNPGHWMAAAKAADRALAADRKSVEASALRAQAYYASVIDEGLQIDARINQGKRSINQLRKDAAAGPEVDKAEALMAVVERRPKDALDRLASAKRAAPRDPSLPLFFGWAHASARNWEKAAASFTKALELHPGSPAARFGLAEAQLAMGNKKAARETYTKLITDYREAYKRDHVGALVGAAQLTEVEKFSDREEGYKEILNRKELAEADPRAISKVGALAGFEALRAGRVQEASQLFAASRKLDPENLAAVVGVGEVHYAEGRYDAARELLARVLTVDPNNLQASLALAAVAVKQENLTEAKELLKAVFDRKPPVTEASVLARAHRIRALVYTTEPGMIGKVEEEYRKAMELSGERSIAPALELARFLVKQERDQDAREVLEPINKRAASDPGIAVSLGVAYLFAGDPAAAETSFRAALSQRANDVEARYQLGAALLAQKRDDEGLAAMKSAYNTDRSREDIGVALAVAYEERKRFEDAEALYESLLKGAEPSLNVKARAGRYFARYGSMERAIKLGDEIAAEHPRHPAALYLVGEKEYLANNFDDAQRAFLDAAELEPQAQYFEGAGRAAERNKLFPDALESYNKAIALEADYLAPRLGSARIFRARRQFSKAIEALDEALKLAPNNAWAHFARGDSLLELRQEAAAVSALRRAVRLDPDHAEANYKLGRGLFDLDKPRPAAAALARARRHAKDEPWLTECLRLLGYAYRQSGNRSGAIEAFRAYEERNPEDGPTFRDARSTRLYLEGGGR